MIKFILRLACAGSGFLAALTVHALPQEAAVPGGIALVRLGSGAERPQAWFGDRRVAVPVGTPVVAAGRGIVVEAGDYFFNGNSVYIDHGQGLVTLYCHLERIEVLPGEPVAVGQRIGLSDNTGRTSGPHLHWTVLANGTAVDPRLFLPRPRR